MPRYLSILTLIVVSSFFLMSFQEEDHAKNPQVPQLKEMHHVIHPMWHDAYPNKDVDQLKELYPELEKYYQNLKDAEFPEEWPDREMHWNEGIANMGNTLKEYKEAMENENSEELLTSARRLHDDFENLVMIINPPIPELDEFHKVLFHVYHDYLPAEDWQKVRESVPMFQEKVKQLGEAKLPGWMAEKDQDFRNACQNLENAIDQLAALDSESDDMQWENAIEEIHTAYVAVASTME